MNNQTYSISKAMLLAVFILIAGCSKQAGIGGIAGEATEATVQANKQFGPQLKLDDQQDVEDAKRGLIAQPDGKIVA